METSNNVLLRWFDLDVSTSCAHWPPCLLFSPSSTMPLQFVSLPKADSTAPSFLTQLPPCSARSCCASFLSLVADLMSSTAVCLFCCPDCCQSFEPVTLPIASCTYVTSNLKIDARGDDCCKELDVSRRAADLHKGTLVARRADLGSSLDVLHVSSCQGCLTSVCTCHYAYARGSEQLHLWRSQDRIWQAGTPQHKALQTDREFVHTPWLEAQMLSFHGMHYSEATCIPVQLEVCHHTLMLLLFECASPHSYVYSLLLSMPSCVLGCGHWG